MKRSIRLLALAAAGILITATVPFGHAAPQSPVGDWDFVLGGKQRGVAFISFNPDSTITGGEIIVPVKPRTPKTPTSDPRNPEGITTRPSDTPTTTPTTGSSSTTSNVIGGSVIGGFWTFDSNGRVIGNLSQIYQDLDSTTTVTTNATNTVIVLVKKTNGVAFRGVVTTGVRMTFNAYTSFGAVTYKGVPTVDLTDLDGDYTAETKRNGLLAFEFFTLEQDPSVLNAYNITNGLGGSYNFNGLALISRQKQMAIYTITDEETPRLSTYVGSFNSTTRRGTLKGANNNPSYGISYKIFERQ